MKGYLWTHPSTPVAEPGRLQRWESIAVEAVGNVIEFWGFKRNQGRVWALLYLRDATLTAAEIETELGLSKGGVSMLTRDLERWGVLVRVRQPGDSSWRYRAETDLTRMARNVIEQREFAFISRIRADLAEARRLAEADRGVQKAQVRRLARMEALAEATEKALRLFLKTSRLDVGSAFGLLNPSSSSHA